MTYEQMILDKLEKIEEKLETMRSSAFQLSERIAIVENNYKALNTQLRLMLASIGTLATIIAGALISYFLNR